MSMAISNTSGIKTITTAQFTEATLERAFRDAWRPMPEDRALTHQWCNELVAALHQVEHPQLNATQEAFADRLLVETLAIHLGMDEVGTAAWTIKMWQEVQQLPTEDANEFYRLLTCDLGRSERPQARVKLYAWARHNKLIPEGMSDREWWY